MAHAQKPDLVFQRNGRVHLYRRGCQFSRLLAGEVCASAVVMLDRPCPIQCTTAGYPLHLPFSPSLHHPCVSVCHQIPFLLYLHRRGMRSGSVESEFVSASLLKVGSSGMIHPVDVSADRNAVLFKVKQPKKIRMLFEPEGGRNITPRNLC